MIHDVIERWHRYLRGDLPGGLDELLDDDVVFFSPIVFTPQRGRQITSTYLRAATQVLGGGSGPTGGGPAAGSGGFRYARQVLDGDTAVLEFETTMDGIYVNGVDIITANDEGRIVEFKVMLRPLQAVNLVHRQMAAMLEAPRARE